MNDLDTSGSAIPPGQTLDGVFAGASFPVNKKLSEIFLQLHISEKRDVVSLE